jgi:carbamoyl-phosphate synthase small subunit
VLDYGTKKNILQCMVDRGAHVKVFPAKSTLEELKAFQPAGIYFQWSG